MRYVLRILGKMVQIKEGAILRAVRAAGPRVSPTKQTVATMPDVGARM